jgi:hypothetical protein
MGGRETAKEEVTGGMLNKVRGGEVARDKRQVERLLRIS